MTPEAKKDSTEKKDSTAAKVKPVRIDFDGIENRVVILPLAPGNYGNPSVGEGKLLYLTVMPVPPKEGPGLALKYFDFAAREEKQIIDGIDGYELSADGKKVLVIRKNDLAVLKPEPDQKMEKNVPLDKLEMTLAPREEWQQLFADVWRIERDYFYDAAMHGVDWPAMRKRYGDLIASAATRGDINFLIGELIGELNASHTYRGGGDMTPAKQKGTGYLGVDWAAENGFFRIKKIIRGAPWDTEVRSALDVPGLRVQEGDYVLAVNGRALDIQTNPAVEDRLAPPCRLP